MFFLMLQMGKQLSEDCLGSYIRTYALPGTIERALSSTNISYKDPLFPFRPYK